MDKDKSQIADDLQRSFSEVFEYCTNLTEENYWEEKEDRWSIAENINHLILSTSPLVQGLNLPKLVIATVGGKQSGKSRNYDELVSAYKQKLDEGGKATSRYVPKKSKKHPMSSSLAKFDSNGKGLVKALNKWTEEQLDAYRMPHPLLGKISVREMLYFSIYHNYHHLEAIKK